MNLKGYAGVVVLGWMAPMMALSDDAPPPPPQAVWTGKGQAGYTSSEGNSEAKAANAALDAAYVDGPWKHALHIGGLYGQSDGIVAAERWDASWQTDYALTTALYTFGALRYQHDLFNGFEYQTSATTGLGYEVFAEESTKLDVQVGVGYKVVRPEDLTKNSLEEVVGRTPEPSESGPIGALGINYSQALTSTTTLTDKLLVESGASDTLVKNTLALAVKISTKLALSVGYSLEDNTKPPEGLKKLDTLETLNLVYAF